MSKLTLKQERFAKEYVRNGDNALQAAISAGYSKNTAHAKSSEWLEKVGISQAIEAERKKIGGPDNRLQKKVMTRLETALDEGEHRDAIAAVRELAKILGMYAPEKHEHSIMNVHVKYISYLHGIISEVAGSEVANNVMDRIERGNE